MTKSGVVNNYLNNDKKKAPVVNLTNVNFAIFLNPCHDRLPRQENSRKTWKFERRKTGRRSINCSVVRLNVTCSKIIILSLYQI